MSVLTVQSPGLFTTVQDLGRPHYGPIGVSASGAADSLSLRLGNRLLGNPETAAALEMTLQGGKFTFSDDTLVALTGADFESSIPRHTPALIRAGELLEIGRPVSGARAYLCVRGGIAVPLLLGSASTHILSGLGGYEGRALRKGDILSIGPAPTAPPRRAIHPGILPHLAPRTTLRVTEGPQASWFPPTTQALFYSSAYQVTPEANRMGLRLQGPRLELPPRQLVSEGIANGCIQVPASGQPVILFVEQQTTGGYPKIANVVAADLPFIGQLKPGDHIRFQLIDLRHARELLYVQERFIKAESTYL